MSAKKRRWKRKLELLRKLDANYAWLYLKTSPRRDPKRAWPMWYGCVVALGDALEKRKPGAWASLPRRPMGTEILLHNFAKRQRGEKA